MKRSSLGQAIGAAGLVCLASTWASCSSDGRPSPDDDCDAAPEICDLQPAPPGRTDAGLEEVPCRTWYADVDHDGLGDPNATARCFSPGSVQNADDPEPKCRTNDSDACGVCAGKGAPTWYADRNADQLGDWTNETASGCAQPAGYVATPPPALPAGCTLTSDALGCVENASCDKNCTVPECGDSSLNTAAGEQCESPSAKVGDLYAPCYQCRTNGSWTKSFARADANDTVRGLCVTSSDEVYVASHSKLFKYTFSGELLWELATTGNEGSIAHIACNAEYGVAAVGDVSMWVRRWAPNGQPAYARKVVSPLAAGKQITMRSDGSVVVAGVDGAWTVFVQEYTAAGVALATTPISFVGNGTPIALTAVAPPPNATAIRLLLHRDFGTANVADAELRRYVVGSVANANYGAEQSPSRDSLFINQAIFLPDTSVLIVGDIDHLRTDRVGFAQQLSTSNYPVWPTALQFKDAGGPPRSVTMSARGTVLLGRQTGGGMFLTEFSLDKSIVRDWATQLAMSPSRIAEASDGSVIVAGEVFNSATNLCITRLAFTQLAPIKPPTANGGMCQAPAECASKQCISGVCQASGTPNGGTCQMPANCLSNFCLNGACEPVALASGESCKDARQCSAGLCASGKCN